MEHNNVRGKFCFDPELINRITEYLQTNEYLQKYEICSVMQYEHPDDYYLYKVLCRNKTDDTYTFWSAWNNITCSLNYGHYELEYHTAMREFLER